MNADVQQQLEIYLEAQRNIESAMVDMRAGNFRMASMSLLMASVAMSGMAQTREQQAIEKEK